MPPLALRFVIPLLLALTAIAYAVLPLVDRLTLRWFVRDLDIRSELIARSVQDSVIESSRTNSSAGMLQRFTEVTRDERLFALGYCRPGAEQAVATRAYPRDLNCRAVERYTRNMAHLKESPRGLLHVTVFGMPAEGGPPAGRLVLLHDMHFVERRTADMRRYILYFFVGLGLVVSLITVSIAQLSWRSWVHGMRDLLRAEHSVEASPTTVVLPEFRPLERDLRAMIDEMRNEYRPRDEDQIAWDANSIRGILRETLHGEEILVVSNREPYIHVYEEERVQIQRPASGLVTALEPIMRACSGTWIAHGSGSADREAVDGDDRVAVPPDNPAYRIRRIWLTAEEEAGYYYGFANEGLWPLCHIAHVRPTFRSTDWQHYVRVNRRFADAVCIESKVGNPIVLVQDYHFALLPRMIHERLPEAIVITFWHIPWPNPESFAICPWQAELLAGLLGSSILGFHTRSHCNNFLDSVDRALEARVDRELSTVNFNGDATAIKRYPISIEWPPAAITEISSPCECQGTIRRRHDLGAGHYLGMGVDRMDYTKGILERLLAVERLFELQPEWLGRFSFVQIAAPTRTSIDEYQELERRLRALAGRINDRFADDGYHPIILIIAHHDPATVYQYYRAANVCLVTSLHDGMNLVAKEFIAARSDEQGVLVLSRFTGAARELPEALVVNPYDIDQCAMALHTALTMPPEEQCHRMRLMRGLVKEFNVFRWAGRMLLDAASVRQRERIKAISELSGLKL